MLSFLRKEVYLKPLISTFRWYSSSASNLGRLIVLIFVTICALDPNRVEFSVVSSPCVVKMCIAV